MDSGPQSGQVEGRAASTRRGLCSLWAAAIECPGGVHRARRAAPEENPHAGRPSCEQTQMPAVTVYTCQARAECVSRDPDAPEANCTSQPPNVTGKGCWDVSTSLLGQRTLFFGIWT